MLFSTKRRLADWRRLFKVSLILTFVAGFLLGGLVLAAKKVEIIDQGETKRVTTLAWTVEGALEFAGVAYTPEDLVVPSPHKPLKDGMSIEVFRAEAVTLEADGRQWVIKAVKPKAKELLTREGVFLGPLDQVDTNLDQGDDGPKFVKVTRIIEELVEERFELPHGTFKQPDNKMLTGQQKVLQTGQNGVLVKKVRIVKADGEEVSREVIGSRILVEPQRSVVAYGIADNTVLPAARSLQGNVKKVMTMEATAYTHTGNPTATGIYPYKGVIAVDPKVIPLGSRLYVEGYGYCEAQDTGGAIKGDRIDIFLDSEKDCIQWGRKIVQVYLLD